MTDPATCLWRIVVVTDDPATRLGLLPGFEIALESSGSQFTALAQLTKQHGINRRMDHEQVPCSDQLVLVDTWRSTLEQLAQGCTQVIGQDRIDTALQLRNALGMVSLMSLGLAQVVGGDELTALQVMDQQLVVLCADTHTGLLPRHGHRVLVGLPGDQAGLVDLAGLDCLRHVQQAMWDQIGLELATLQRLEMRSWMLSRRAVQACIGHRLKPVMQVLANGVLVLDLLTVEAVALDVLDPGLHLALALRVV